MDESSLAADELQIAHLQNENLTLQKQAGDAAQNAAKAQGSADKTDLKARSAGREADSAVTSSKDALKRIAEGSQRLDRIERWTLAAVKIGADRQIDNKAFQRAIGTAFLKGKVQNLIYCRGSRSVPCGSSEWRAASSSVAFGFREASGCAVDVEAWRQRRPSGAGPWCEREPGVQVPSCI